MVSGRNPVFVCLHMIPQHQAAHQARSDHPTCLVVGHVHLPELQDALGCAGGAEWLEAHISQIHVRLCASSVHEGGCKQQRHRSSNTCR